MFDTSVDQEFSLALAHDPSDNAPAVLNAAGHMAFFPVAGGVDDGSLSTRGAAPRSAGRTRPDIFPGAAVTRGPTTAASSTSPQMTGSTG